MDPYWHNVTYADVYERLGSSDRGLSDEETLPRVSEFGLNEIGEEKRFSLLELVLEPFQNFIIILLLIATVIAAALGEMLDAVAIAIAIAINVTVSFIQEYRAEKAIEALKRLGALHAKVVRGNEERIIPARELVPGDVVVLEVGSKVPADLRLTEAYLLKVDESMLTGESLPVKKDPSPLDRETPLSERSNMAYSGTVVTTGRGRGIVVATGRNTQIGAIADMVRQAEEEETPLQQRLDELGKQIGWFGISVCILFFLIGSLTKDPDIDMTVHIVNMFMTAVTLGVAVVPEGLAAVVTITLAIGLQRLARLHGIIRRLPAVETLGCATVICSDKTGTLTRNEISVRDVYLDGGLVKLEGGRPRLDTSLTVLLSAASLCNNANRTEGGIVGDPLEGALITLSDELGMDHRAVRTASPRRHEIPFDPANKYMATVNASPDGDMVAYVKGAPEVVIARCERELAGGKERPLSSERRAAHLEACHEMAGRGLRVFGFAFRKLKESPCEFAPERLVFVGLMGMMDPPREDAIKAVRECQEAGIRVVMITGDHKRTAESVALQMGILREGQLVIEGSELDVMPDDELERVVERVAVFARATPEHKTRIVKALKARGHVAAMTGDGVNDAPALKSASIGVAMGRRGTDVAKEASDLILADDDFATIAHAVREGRTIYDNIKKFLRFQLTTNVSAIVTLFFAPLANLPVPFSPIQILWINLLMDGPPALALGAEPASKDIMRRPPRDPEESVLTRRMLGTIIISGLWRAVATLLVLWWFVQLDPSAAGVARAKTIAFCTFIVFQFFNSFNCKSDDSILRTDLFSNKFLYLAVGAAAALQLAIVHFPPLQAAFHTVALGARDWALVVAVAATGVVVEEMRKAYDRGASRLGSAAALAQVQ